MSNVEIVGANEVVKNLGKISDQLVRDCYEKAIEDVGIKIGELSESKVPVDKGILKASFTVQKIGGVWYAGFNTEYAAYIHQGMSSSGNPLVYKNGGEKYFLLNTIILNKNQLLEFFSERLQIYFDQIKL